MNYFKQEWYDNIQILTPWGWGRPPPMLRIPVERFYKTVKEFQN